jgi:hypothetical protein
MSAHVEYDPALFALHRAVTVSARLGEFTIGRSLLGATVTTWATYESATVSISAGYSPDENGTLIVDPETATISLSYWDQPGPLLYPGDRIECVYDGEQIFTGTISSAQLTYSTDPGSLKHGAWRRVDFTATAAGVYAVVMGRTVSWKSLPAESAITRIRRWVTVNGF